MRVARGPAYHPHWHSLSRVTALHTRPTQPTCERVLAVPTRLCQQRRSRRRGEIPTPQALFTNNAHRSRLTPIVEELKSRIDSNVDSPTVVEKMMNSRAPSSTLVLEKVVDSLIESGRKGLASVTHRVMSPRNLTKGSYAFVFDSFFRNSANGVVDSDAVAKEEAACVTNEAATKETVATPCAVLPIAAAIVFVEPPDVVPVALPVGKAVYVTGAGVTCSAPHATAGALPVPPVEAVVTYSPTPPNLLPGPPLTRIAPMRLAPCPGLCTLPRLMPSS